MSVTINLPQNNLPFKAVLFIICLLSMTYYNANANCNQCNTLVCDGGNCDDGSSADGVQTARNCACGQIIDGACAKVEVDFTNSPYYDPNAPTTSLYMEAQESGNFSVFYTDANCNVTDCSTPDYVISSGTLLENLPGSVFTLLVCKNGGNAGRRDFTLTVSSSTIENCVNNFDDDGNSLIDCDDPACTNDPSCDFSEATGGESSGTESNSRLAEKIAKRNYQRVVDDKTPMTNSDEFRVFDHTLVKRKNNEVTVQNFIPIDILPNSETFLSSPTDLIPITNAVDVFSVDYYMNEGRVASILALESNNGVYEHTKYVCDRLHGAEILDLWNFPLDDINNFIVVKYLQPNGIIEYSTSLSFYENENGNYNVESHWNLDDYTFNDQYYTLQIWANNISNLQGVTNEVLSLIKNEKTIDQYSFSDIPNLYIKKIEYQNHIVKLHVINHSASNSIEVTSNILLTEDSEEIIEDHSFELSGTVEEIIEYNTQGIYAIGMSIEHQHQTVKDLIYFADGVWGYDALSENATINQFEISPEEYDYLGDGYLIERDFNISGTVKNFLTVYRSLNASFSPENLNEFNMISFQGQGNTSIEITAVKSSIQNWEDQMRFNLELTDGMSDYSIPMSNFYSSLGIQDWSDITMLVFAIKGNYNTYENFECGIQNIYFSTDALSSQAEIEQQNEIVYPNPVKDFAEIILQNQTASDYQLNIYSSTGKIIAQKNGHLDINDRASIPFVNDNYPAGIYYFEIILDNRERKHGKFIIAH